MRQGRLHSVSVRIRPFPLQFLLRPRRPLRFGSALARVGPTHRRIEHASGRLGRSDRSRLVRRDDITANERGAMVRNGLSSGPALVPVPDTDSGRGQSSARPDHERWRLGRGRQLIRVVSPFPGLNSPQRHATSSKERLHRTASRHHDEGSRDEHAPP